MVMESTPATEVAELRRPGRLVNPEDLASDCDLLSMALNGTNTGFLGARQSQFSSKQPSNSNSNCRGQDGFAFSPSMAGSFFSKWVMLDTLAGDAEHSNCEPMRVKVCWGTE